MDARALAACYRADYEAAEAIRAALRAAVTQVIAGGYLQHKDGCEKKRGNAFGFKSNGCTRCFGTGYIPSETCDDCVDCQDECPECKGRLAVLTCTCGLDQLSALLARPEET